jgi:hypothetical protein
VAIIIWMHFCFSWSVTWSVTLPMIGHCDKMGWFACGHMICSNNTAIPHHTWSQQKDQIESSYKQSRGSNNLGLCNWQTLNMHILCV